MASPSSPVFQLHAEGKLYMRIAVPEKDVAVVTEGMTGTLAVDAVMGRSFMFSVALVSPIIEQVTRTCTVDLLVTVGEGETVKLKPGMTGEATLVLDQQDGVLAVPRDAIVDREGETVVFKVVDDRAVMVPVKVLGEYGDFVMAEGVAEGDELVLKGQVDLEDGVAVAIATLE
jgi:multidrug efflux pump subunit AcrA (membrane-fusion protein)